ncbi:hypothetical protein BT63DRAFT_427739 [Microthyrium microscopicum]|uniref:Uncharacterized protein n=1 Tax=Microthyrium microscopicum TaxID=703497 RepID=A0A6A6U1G4_9PEZI|nr:hypothetical protein BT63DRAFT_427739 [Microthyrium microscopicum]
MSSPRPSSSGGRPLTPKHHDWVTVGLLISLAPLSITLGLLVALSDAVSRVVGHRGKLLPRLNAQSSNRRLNGRPQPPSQSVETTAILEQPRGPKYNVLITGSTPLALAMAREFTKNGHRVTVSDHETVRRVNRARYSRGVSSFLPMKKVDTYAWPLFGRSTQTLSFPEQMLLVVKAKQPNIWLPCDDSITEEEMMQAVGVIKSRYPEISVYSPGPEALNLSWDSTEFTQYVESLDLTIRTPRSSIVMSRGEVHRMIGSPGRTKSVHLTGPVSNNGTPEPFVKGHRWRDSGYSEGSSTDGKDSLESSQLEKSFHLPLENLSKTYDLLSSLSINSVSPWKASSVVIGRPCIVHALIVENSMRAFTAYLGSNKITYPATEDSESDSFADTINPMDQDSPLVSTLQQFSKGFISKLPGYVSGTISLRFILVETSTSFGLEVRPCIIQCQFGLPKALLGIPDAAPTWALGMAKPCVRMKQRQASIPKQEITSGINTGVYSLPGAFFFLFLRSIFGFVTFQLCTSDVLCQWRVFVDKVMYWREELWDSEDPGPFFWFWIVEQPIVAFLELLSRILRTFRIMAPLE